MSQLLKTSSYFFAFLFLCFVGFPLVSLGAPPSLTIIHFDVNVGDATLIISPGGRGILIDAGKTGRGLDPIVEYMYRAKKDGILKGLDYAIVTHYDLDHLGGMDEVLENGWYPEKAVFDRGMKPIKRLDKDKAEECLGDDASKV